MILKAGKEGLRRREREGLLQQGLLHALVDVSFRLCET